VRAEVVGALEDELGDKKKTHELSWDPLRSDDSRPGILVKVAHARAGEVVVKKVNPQVFQVSIAEHGRTPENAEEVD
jgi:hypothetical protein